MSSAEILRIARLMAWGYGAVITKRAEGVTA